MQLNEMISSTHWTEPEERRKKSAAALNSMARHQVKVERKVRTKIGQINHMTRERERRKKNDDGHRYKPINWNYISINSLILWNERTKKVVIVLQLNDSECQLPVGNFPITHDIEKMQTVRNNLIWSIVPYAQFYSPSLTSLHSIILCFFCVYGLYTDNVTS